MRGRRAIGGRTAGEVKAFRSASPRSRGHGNEANETASDGLGACAAGRGRLGRRLRRRGHRALTLTLRAASRDDGGCDADDRRADGPRRKGAVLGRSARPEWTGYGGGCGNVASGDGSVATVDASGLATAVGNGSATITAVAGSASGTATVTVAARLWTLSGTVSHGWSVPLASGLDTAMAGDIPGAVVEVIEGADAGRRAVTDDRGRAFCTHLGIRSARRSRTWDPQRRRGDRG